MKKRIKDLWTSALRSGKYVQGVGALLTNDKYCCLGVLCQLHADEHGGKFSNVAGIMAYDGETSVLSFDVMEWAGLDRGNPILDVEGFAGETKSLTNLNDQEHYTFSQIADEIEEHL